MRHEWFVLLAACGISAWLFFDEEPVLDLTDLGLIQTVCLILVVLSVAWDNFGRTENGFFVSRDRQLALWTLTFFSGLDNYFKLVTLGFFAHSLVPLWVDQAETVNLYAFTAETFWVWGAQTAALLTFTLCVMYSTTRVPMWLVLLPTLLVGWALSVGDMLASGLGSNYSPLNQSAKQTPYGFTASACTYSPQSCISGFDWHKAQVEPNNFFFVDLASFLYGLFIIVNLLLLIYACVLGVIATYLTPSRGVSYTYRAAVIRLAEHSLVGAIAGMSIWVSIALRLGFDHYSIAL